MELLGELAAEAVPLETFEECGENEVLMHLHTSGTTGVPKTVRYVKGRFLQELSDCVEALGFPEGEVFQQMSQLFHSACIGTYSCLASGGTVVLVPEVRSGSLPGKRGKKQGDENERHTDGAGCPFESSASGTV